MKVLSHRVDALTLAYRVRLDPSFVKALKRRSEVAKEHGRASFTWAVRTPDDDGDGTIAKLARIGPVRLRWADENGRVKRAPVVWGELRYSRSDKAWHIVNAPFYQLHIVLCAPGGGELRDCPACKGLGVVNEPGHAPAACSVCDGAGSESDPGWNVEIKWYAETLASWGLERTMAESAALAANIGDVFETRVWRFDLAADVEGWEIDHEDVKARLVKRSKAKWSFRDDGELTEGDVARGPRSRRQREEDGAALYGTRRPTGIDVGRGGAMMARIYDKRVELERDTAGARREWEEERWRKAGWDGESPVARVEFQIRGTVIAELGLRDPDACLEPLYEAETVFSRSGKPKVRMRLKGHRVMTVQTERGEEQATLVHRLDDVWQTCLDWVRLGVPERSRTGGEVPRTRWQDDPRWALLRELRFTDVADPQPIRRYRKRDAATAAQALGITLSQAAREGGLEELSEDREVYAGDEEAAKERLYGRLLALKLDEADRILRSLLDKFGGVAGACEHFAIRNNAALYRFKRGVDALDPAARPPPDIVSDRAVA